MSAADRGRQPRSSTSQQQSSENAWPSARKAAKLDRQTTLRRLRRVRQMQRLRLSGLRLVVVLTLVAPLSSAHTLVPPAALSPPIFGIADAGDNKSEQGPQPYAWVTILCFVMILAGFAWAACVRLRLWPSRWYWHTLLLSGVLSLAVSIVWTTILHTVDASPRYLALGCWSMLMISFISVSYEGVQQPRQYAFMVLPTFLLALHLTLYLVNQHVDSAWGPRRFYENAPPFYTLWVVFMRCLYHDRNAINRPAGRQGGSIDPETGLGGGAGAIEMSPRGVNEPN